MIAASQSSRGVVGIRVLDADPDLADALDEHEVEEARHSLVAPVITLDEGDWSPRHAIPAKKGHLGVLVTDGILCREVVVGDSVCAELVGPGDLLRPWDGVGAGALVSCDVRWHVLEEAQLAILSRRFATVAARWPALTSALVARAVSRSNALALSATISCTTGLETRLLMLFWHMADRWGRVRRDGVLVPVQMTHELIARLIGARRPSVSTALKRLERDAQITRLNGTGWLLGGAPPKSVLQDPFECDEAASAGDGERPRLELVSGYGAGASDNRIADDTGGSAEAAPLRAEPATCSQTQAGVRRGSGSSQPRGTVRRRAGALRASP